MVCNFILLELIYKPAKSLIMYASWKCKIHIDIEKLSSKIIGHLPYDQIGYLRR